MTPDKYEHLQDQFDAAFREGNAKDDITDPVVAANDGVNDPEAAAEMALFRVAVAAVRHNAVNEEVRAVRQQYLANQAGAAVIPMAASREVGFMRRITANALKIAAVLVLAISLTGLGEYMFTSPARFYEKYYSSYELDATRGSGSPDALAAAYQGKNWAAVLAAFDAKHSKNGRDYFLTAMAYMEQKEYYEAIGLFTMLLRDNGQSATPYFEEEAEYYLAMSYLATHQTSSALIILDKIKADPNHLFNKQVRNMSGLSMLFLRAK